MKKYVIAALFFSFCIAFTAFFSGNEAKAAVRPRPTATPRPEINYNWIQGSNQALLTESGDYTMAWWSWFRPEIRPYYGKPYILLNHSKDKKEWFGKWDGFAFNPNRTKPVNLIEFYYQDNLVSFSIYSEVEIVAPGKGYRVIVAAQNFGPIYKEAGIGLAGVRVFMSQNLYNTWVQKVNP